jgi:hypothetical protein
VIVAGDKVHHVTECELALGETKPGDQVLWPEAGNIDGHNRRWIDGSILIVSIDSID